MTERVNLAELLGRSTTLAPPQLARVRAFRAEHPSLDPRLALHALLAEGTVGVEELNIALGSLLSRNRAQRHLVDISGRVLGPWRLAQRLGPPPGGTSYLAEPAAGAGPPAVLKLLAPTPTEDEFLALAARVRSLSHPNLCPVQDAAVADGLPFLVLAHRPGPTFEELDLPPGPEGAARGLAWALQAARALEHLHAHGLVHGHLVPEDFVIGPDGIAVLTDLGVLSLDPDAPLRHAFSAGAAYAAPEVLRGEPLDLRSDLYSLGAVLHRLFARRPPFEALTPGALFQVRLLKKPSADELLRAGVSPALTAVVSRLLDDRPAERFPDAASVVAALAATAPASKPAAPAARPAQIRPAPTRRVAPAPKRSSLPLLLASSMLILASFVIVLVILALRRQPEPAPVAAVPPPPPAPEEKALPPPPIASDRSAERFKLLASAREEERKGRLAEGLRLYREAAAIQSDPLVAEKIQAIEAALREGAREEADFEQLQRAVATLPAEAASKACEDFLARRPRSRFAEQILSLRRELAVRLLETPKPPETPQAPEPPKPLATPEPPKRVPGVPGRALDPSVREALVWLARHQNPDGSWRVTGHAARCSGKPCEPNPGHEAYDAGVSALSVLAILGAGIGWHDQDEYAGQNVAEAMRRGALHLAGPASADGILGGKARPKHLYNHALGVYALAEAARSAGDLRLAADPDLARLRDAHLAAAETLVAAQNPTGGWRYSSRCGDSDSSVTATAAIALDAAKAAGAPVPPLVFQGAIRWFDSVTETATGRAGYTHRGTGKVFVPGMNEQFNHQETLTAAAALCRMKVAGGEAKTTKSSLALVLRGLPSADPNDSDAYYWYYGTRLVKLAGDEATRTRWREALLRAFERLRPRDASSCARGSWEPWDRWSGEGGRVYVTALNALTLEHALMPRPFEYARRAAPAAAPPAEAAEVRWIFHLKSGGQVRVVSYEEVGDKYQLKLPAGQSVVPKDDVQQILKAPPKDKP